MKSRQATGDLSLIQVGANAEEGVVKLRAPDKQSQGGYVVQRLSATAARSLAEWLEDGVPNKVLRISDGQRWAEHTLLTASLSKIASDLRHCADMVESHLGQKSS